MQLTNEWYYFTAALDSRTCDKIIALGGDDFKEGAVDVSKGITSEERVTGKKQVMAKDPKIRKSDIKWVQEQWLYDLIWPYMVTANDKAGWKFDIRAAESVQLTRYRKEGFYGWHRDGKSDHLSVYKQPGNKFLDGHVRKLSMTVLLNDDFEGGGFEFAGYNKGKFKIQHPTFEQPGSIIVFPSFLEHRVAPVTKGERYSLVVWFLGPPFK